MKKFLALLFVVSAGMPCLFAQTSPSMDYIRQPALGVSFILNDFNTPQRIRTTSLSAVLRDKSAAKLKDMSPGIGLSFFKGLRNHIDFAGNLNASFVNVLLANSEGSSDNNLLLEGDASVNLKMLTEQYWFTPYIIAGIGASKYKGYYGAFVPVGGGLKVNFFDEAHLFITTQYRIPVTNETSNYHFVHSIGIAGIIGQKKQGSGKTVETP